MVLENLVLHAAVKLPEGVDGLFRGFVFSETGKAHNIHEQNRNVLSAHPFERIIILGKFLNHIW